MANGILISALVAGLAAILVTVAIERWGGLHGGIIGTVPSTIIPAALGIWFAAANVGEFQAAMGIVPIGLILNAMFLYLWRIIPQLIPQWRFSIRLFSITAATLGLWLVGAIISVYIVRFLYSSGLDWALIGILGVAIGVLIGVLACLNHLPTPRGHNPVGPLTLFVRGLAAAASIGIAVWLAGIGNPLASGVMSIFPAIFTTSMVALWLAQGEAVPAGAIGPMMLGAQSVSVYALVCGGLYSLADNILGIALFSILAWIVSVTSVNLTVWIWLNRRAKQAGQG